MTELIPRKALNGSSKTISIPNLMAQSPSAIVTQGKSVPANPTAKNSAVSREVAMLEATTGASHQEPLRRRLKMEISRSWLIKKAVTEATAMRLLATQNERSNAAANPA